MFADCTILLKKLIDPTLKITGANPSLVYISQLLMMASTDVPPIHGGTYDSAAHRFLPQTHTLGSLKAQKTISITEGPSSQRGCREKPMVVSRGGESQLSNKASSICIHRHGYCLQWASPC